MKRTTLISHLNELLRVGLIPDSSRNGLQVEGADDVSRVALAVDACAASFARATEVGAQMLIVHHGLFWEKPLLPVGPHGRRLRILMQANINLYAAHLPLDCHPKLGNNAELARLLGLRKTRPFGEHHGMDIGVSGTLPQALSVAELAERLERATGEAVLRVLDFGPKRVRKIGCISGGAGGMLDQAATSGLDAYVTGETRHSSFHDAAEYQVNVLFGGHYATETVGLKALAKHLEKEFGLETCFIDLPTGW